MASPASGRWNRLDDRDCDWFLTHEPHEWEYKRTTYHCSGEPRPVEHPITHTDTDE